MPRPSKRRPPAPWPVKKPRIALYEPWGGNIDTGWTRWLFEQFHFPFTLVHNADLQDGHLAITSTPLSSPKWTRARSWMAWRPVPCPANTPAASAKPARRRCAISSPAGRHAGDAGQCHALRHGPVQSGAHQRRAGRSAKPVLLLRLVAARGSQGPESPGDGGSAGQPGDHV